MPSVFLSGRGLFGFGKSTRDNSCWSFYGLVCLINADAADCYIFTQSDDWSFVFWPLLLPSSLFNVNLQKFDCVRARARAREVVNTGLIKTVLLFDLFFQLHFIKLNCTRVRSQFFFHFELTASIKRQNVDESAIFWRKNLLFFIRVIYFYSSFLSRKIDSEIQRAWSTASLAYT